MDLKFPAQVGRSSMRAKDSPVLSPAEGGPCEAPLEDGVEAADENTQREMTRSPG